jgi:dienelactone hydrolase
MQISKINNCPAKGKRLIITVLILTIAGSFLTHAQVSSGISDDSACLDNTKTLSDEEINLFREQLFNNVVSYLKNDLKASVKNRQKSWNRDYTSTSNYIKSVSPNRQRLAEITGVVDERVKFREIDLKETTGEKAIVCQTSFFTIYSVKWPVLDGVTGEGLLLEPKDKAVAQVVAIPDADWSPEMLAGLDSRLDTEAQYARKLAMAGCRVIIPLLVNRDNLWSGNPEIKMTNQPHREFIYRRSYEMGRHIIGYEIQKILAIVDWFDLKNKINKTQLPIAVAGYGEGGLLALYSTAIDLRINGVLVSGYFQEREDVWEEPIYRNIWGLLNEFGDAEIASLIAPRTIIIEASKGPQVDGPPQADRNHNDSATPGKIASPPLESVQKEKARTEIIYRNLKATEKLQLTTSDDNKGFPGSAKSLDLLLSRIGIKGKVPATDKTFLIDERADFNPSLRLYDQFVELNQHLDKIIRKSETEREKFWKKADLSFVNKWTNTSDFYREHFEDEVIGKMPKSVEQLNPRSKLRYQTPKWRGYWIKLDVWPSIFTGGILLIPNDVKKDEKRPLIVCQHGLGGTPEMLVDKRIKSVYNAYAAQLADLGYIVYVPQHIYGLMPDQPYGEQDFRTIQRMANPVKKSIYSFVVGQERQAMRWLKQLPFVDDSHIALYGISYGGKTAMRVPAILQDYSVVVCSADFNEWVWKTTSLDFMESYLFSPEYDMYEFNLGNTYNYAEMTRLISPRPFMVERGRFDSVGKDEWVAYEFAKVQRMYELMGVGNLTEIEYFNGPHEIHGIGTFEFLHKHLMNKDKR